MKPFLLCIGLITLLACADVATAQTLTPPEAKATLAAARTQATSISELATANAPTSTPTGTSTPMPSPTLTATPMPTSTPEPTATIQPSATNTALPTMTATTTPTPQSVIQASAQEGLPASLQCVIFAGVVIVILLICYRILLPTFRR